MFRRSIQITCVAAFTGIATAGAAAAQDAYRVSGGEVTVVCPLTVGGSFEAKTKNVSGVLRAIKQCRNEGLAVELDVIGGGEDMGTLKQQASTLGLNGSVRWQFPQANVQNSTSTTRPRRSSSVSGSPPTVFSHG